MKIDLSAVAIVLLFVAPGYLAYWTRNHFAPRSLAPKGPAEEFAGFVVVSACTHGLLGIVAIAFAALGGLELDLHPFGVHFDLFRVFAWADQFDLQGWLALHKGTALAILVIYFGLSCALGYLLGLPLALLDLNWHDSLWGWVRSGKLGNWMNRQGIRGTIGEQPSHLQNSTERARSVRARLQSCRQFSRKMLGFSPCVSLFSIVCNSAAAKAQHDFVALPARLKSCPDTFCSLNGILQEAQHSCERSLA